MKRLILSSVGSNLTLKDKVLSIQLLHPFQLIMTELESQKELTDRFEHEKTPAELRSSHGIESTDPRFCSLLPLWDDVRTFYLS